MTGDYKDLAGKTILVTGASSGIGKAVALALAQQGSHVIITGRDPLRLNDTLLQLGEKGTAIVADLTTIEERQPLIEKVPALDGVCHAAGIIYPFPVRMLQDTQLEKVMSINFTAPALLTSGLLNKKKIKNNASLLFISSIASDYSSKGGGSYSSSKAALEAFSRSITLEHATKKIRSNCLKPGLVKTPILEAALQVSSITGFNYDENAYPLGIGTPEDIASAALFFLSDASRWITGTTLILDGGLTAGV